MSRRVKRNLVRMLSLMMALTMLTTEAFAVVKDVGIGGAYSINDLGQSDNRVTMEELKADYLPFRRTDWLTEYFHKDAEAPAKADLGTAISWLIDNEIISRDASITVSNVYSPAYQGATVPSVTVKKVDIVPYLSKTVGRSDLIMYLYKAVFGPVDARTVGVVTPNTRVENGTKKNLYKMMDEHDYWTTISTPTGGITQQEATGGDNTVSQECYDNPPAHIDTQTVTSNGGTAGTQQVAREAINTSSRWRYTPQGDEYESMFGDTNIFISDVDIAQQANTGAGSQNSGFVTNDAGASGNESNTGSAGDVGYTGSQSDNHNAQQGQVQGSGGINAAISYETDYKQIYYVPGSDILFYRTNDCVELYIQYALSRGVLSSDPVLKTDAYQEIFTTPITGSNAANVNKLHVWSPMATPFLVNSSAVSAINHDTSNVRTTSDTIYNKARFAQGNANRQWNVLGSNYNINWQAGSPGTLTITRNNLFDSNTGYFDSERVSKMQFYKYIYDFIGGAEKTMSSLEVDIINYKYGMQLDALGTEDEVYILKYLIAAGILDYTSRFDFQNLNDPMTYSDFFDILYRVANPNARLDFSKVQLTDSESQWQAQGYASKDVVMVNDQVTSVSPVFDEPLEPNTDPTPFAVVHYDGNGELMDQEVLRAADLLNSVQTFEDDSGVSTAFTDRLGDIYDISTSVGEGDIVSMGSVKIHGMTFSFRGAYVSPTAGGSSTPMAVYCRALDSSGNAVTVDPSSAAAKSADNDILNIFGYYMDELSNSDSRFYDWWESANGVARVDDSWGISPYHWLAVANNWMRDVGDFFTGNDASARYENTPYVDCYYYFCSNVYVIALLQENYGGVYDDLIDMLEEAQQPVERGFWSGLWNTLTGNAHKEKVFHNMIASLQSTVEEYVEGDLSPQSITFYMDRGTNVLGNGSVGVADVHRSSRTMSSGDSFAAVCNAVGNLDKIEVRYNVNGEGNNEMWTLQRTSGVIENMNKMFGNTASEKTAQDVWEHGDTSTANSYSVRLSIETPTTRAELEAAMARGLGRLDYDGATDYGLSLQVQAPAEGDRYGGFVSWKSISQNASLLHIEQIGDCILHNTVTDTYAYFPPEGVDYKYALVGNALVEGDPDEGVAKTMDGGTWYWFDAIKLLIGMQGESSVLNGVEGVTLPNKAVTYHALNIPVVSESGFQGSSLNAIRLRLGAVDALQNVEDSAGGNFIKSQKPTDGYYWANYIAASTSNRVLNMVSRKITYSVDNSVNTKNVAYALVFLRPTDIGSTATVTANMSLQDTLDAVAQAPSDADGAAKWEANKQLCNDFLNWIYCTDGQEYLNTGYLVPEVYIYAENRDVAASLSVAQFGDPTDAMKAHGINYRSLLPVTSGMVDDPGIVPLSWSVDANEGGQTQSMPPAQTAEGEYDEMYRAAYYLGEDYRVAIVGDRVLVHEGFAPGLVGYIGKESNSQVTRYRYRIANRTIQDTSFYVGRTFNLGYYNNDYILEGLPTPKFTVIEIEDGGTVHCQLGPISGVPCKVNGEWVVINQDAVLNKFSDTRYDTTLESIAANKEANSWRYVKENMLETFSSKLNWVNEVVEYPVLNPPVSGRRYAVYNGKAIQVYGEASTNNPINKWTCNIRSYSPTKTYNSVQDDFYDVLSGKGIPNRTVMNYIETYAEVTFSAYDFVVRNNCLIPTEKTGGITTGDLFSPSLFVSINDMIIEQMIYDSKNAIPLNQVPQGSLVQVGEGWYIAANGDETDKKFVGYSPLDGFSSKTTSPRVQDASLSMASHFIRGGNQYINVVHYITDFTVLDDTSSGESSYWTWKDVLAPIGTLKLTDTTLNGTYRVACLASSSTQVGISTGAKMSSSNTATVGYRYAPVLLQFSDLLYAYPVSTGGANPVYKICNFCKNSTGGALDQLPFFASDVINARLNDVTTTVMSGGYVYNNESRFLMDAFREQFDKAFAGDVFTLARMLLFIVLVWLFVMSWVCYGFYFSRLMPMVDAICHPTVDRNAKGIDLFKIFTFGTISVDSDFKLGRFLQYDLIIAILILVVWKSGSITFGV